MTIGYHNQYDLPSKSKLPRMRKAITTNALSLRGSFEFSKGSKRSAWFADNVIGMPLTVVPSASLQGNPGKEMVLVRVNTPPVEGDEGEGMRPVINLAGENGELRMFEATTNEPRLTEEVW